MDILKSINIMINKRKIISGLKDIKRNDEIILHNIDQLIKYKCLRTEGVVEDAKFITDKAHSCIKRLDQLMTAVKENRADLMKTISSVFSYEQSELDKRWEKLAIKLKYLMGAEAS